MRNEWYFCLKLTENEHHIVEGMLRNISPASKVVYYRELKEGHIPMIREVKVRGYINSVQAFMRKEQIFSHIVENPHRA